MQCEAFACNVFAFQRFSRNLPDLTGLRCLSKEQKMYASMFIFLLLLLGSGLQRVCDFSCCRAAQQLIPTHRRAVQEDFGGVLKTYA